jgi:hypothetical protein
MTGSSAALTTSAWKSSLSQRVEGDAGAVDC